MIIPLKHYPMNWKINLNQISHEDLLDLKLRDLDLSIKGSWVERDIEAFYTEIKNKGLKFKPHIWVSEDWYSPDGVPGFAIPFFLLHPRLMKLENEMIGEVEGGNSQWFLKLLRHEAGHAIDNAFGLRKKKRRQDLFGKTSLPYPESYDRKPYSKQYVRHLDASYAQAHPDEDWAETFAVWLNPNSNWKVSYQSWPCLKKLELLNEIMFALKGKIQPVKNKVKTDQLKDLDITLREYYIEKRKRFGISTSPFYEKKLPSILTKRTNNSTLPLAKIIRKQKKDLSKKLASQNKIYQYQAEQFLNEFVSYCSKENVQIKNTDAPIPKELISFLHTESKNYVKMGKHRINM